MQTIAIVGIALISQRERRHHEARSFLQCRDPMHVQK
jgi:hypothetical protein